VVLDQSSVGVEPDVVAQQGVRITARSGAVVVEARGLALQNGRMGQRVQVINLASGDTLAARVTGARTVEIVQ
jgi:flagella basal body P-ring formation protein FlgA